MALLDNGTQMNTITPDFIESYSLEVGPLSDLVGGWVTCVGLGNALTWPVGYIVIRIQVDRVQGYDKAQIALVILDLSIFVAQVPIILGTPTISCIINMIKEKETDGLAVPWVNSWVAYLLAVWWATATIEDSKVVAGKSNPSEYDVVVTTKNTETIDAFSSHVIHARMRTTHIGEGINVMTQALCMEDGSLSRAWWYTTFIWSCAVAVRMSLQWWQIVWHIPRLWGRRPQWWGQLQSHGYQITLCRPVWQRHQKRPTAIKCPSLLWSKGKRSCLRG